MRWPDFALCVVLVAAAIRLLFPEGLRTMALAAGAVAFGVAYVGLQRGDIIPPRRRDGRGP